MTDKYDEWTEWKPDWSFKSKKNKKNITISDTPHSLQERQEPTTSIKLKLTESRTTTKHQQRIVDARLWGVMSPFQQNAALAIDRAFHLMSKGLGYRISAPEKLRTGKSHNNNTDYEGELISVYFEWAKNCQKSNLHHSPALDVLVYGLSCYKVDRNRRVRNGWTRTNLLACLDIYCEMKGWPTDSTT